MLIRQPNENQVGVLMKTAKKITALVLCLVLILSLFGCGDEQVRPAAKKIDPGIDKVGYSVPFLRSDTLDPYKAESELNQSLTTLLYDSLFSVDNSYKAVPQIADNYTFEDKKIEVKLKTVSFTDGTEVTPEDVVFSFVKAKRSSVYRPYLTNLVDCSTADGRSVVFTLEYKNPYELANIFFPIIKKGTEVDEESSDKYSAKLPVGSGRYTLVNNNESRYLEVNKLRLGGYHPKYNRIGLVDVSEETAVPNLFEMGQIDFYTESFSDGVFKRFTGTSSPKSMTNFTFLGINSDRRILRDGKVRRAIALLLSRADMAEVSFGGFGKATSTPFDPDFYGLEGCTLPPIKYDKRAAVELLEEAGFRDIGSAGIRYSEDSSLELSLVVNKENSFRVAMARSIQQSLSKASIKVILREVPYSSYIEYIENGYYDLYIGETRLSNSFDLSGFFNEDGELSYGISAESESTVKYNELEEGTIEMQEFLDTFADELPFIPLAYRQSMTVRSDKIRTDSKTTVSDYYNNVDEWTVK